jgi:hypothetical protein
MSPSEYPKFNSFSMGFCALNPTLTFSVDEKLKCVGSLNFCDRSMCDVKFLSARFQVRKELRYPIYTAVQFSSRFNAVAGVGYKLDICDNVNIESFFYLGKNLENNREVSGCSFSFNIVL